MAEQQPKRGGQLVSTLAQRWGRRAPRIAVRLATVLFGVTASLAASPIAFAQFGLVNDGQLRTQFEFVPRISFEPKLQTNFEPNLPTLFGFQATRSATNVRLSERLNLLQPRLPEERQFVAEVIKLVEQGKLPEPLVDEAFFYSIRRYGGPVPFPYFERILRIQSERLKLPVPDFDRAVYSRENFVPQTFNQ